MYGIDRKTAILDLQIYDRQKISVKGFGRASFKMLTELIKG